MAERAGLRVGDQLSLTRSMVQNLQTALDFEAKIKRVPMFRGKYGGETIPSRGLANVINIAGRRNPGLLAVGGWNRGELRSSCWMLPNTTVADRKMFEGVLRMDKRTSGPHAPVMMVTVKSAAGLNPKRRMFSRGKIEPYIKARVVRCQTHGHLPQADSVPHEVLPEGIAELDSNSFLLGHKCRSSTGQKASVAGPSVAGGTMTMYQWLDPVEGGNVSNLSTFFAAGCVSTPVGFQDFLMLKVYDARALGESLIGMAAFPLDYAFLEPELPPDEKWPSDSGNISLTLVRADGSEMIDAGALVVQVSYLTRNPTPEELAATADVVADASADVGAAAAAAAGGGGGGGAAARANGVRRARSAHVVHPEFEERHDRNGRVHFVREGDSVVHSAPPLEVGADSDGYGPSAAHAEAFTRRENLHLPGVRQRAAGPSMSQLVMDPPPTPFTPTFVTFGTD